VDSALEKVKVTRSLTFNIQIVRENNLLMETQREDSSLVKILTLLISEKTAKKMAKILRSKWAVIQLMEK
jgi:hypothetical protein